MTVSPPLDEKILSESLDHALSADAGLETPGQVLCRAFADTFEGGGWADAPVWENFDQSGQRRWERAAERYAELTAQPPVQQTVASDPRDQDKALPNQTLAVEVREKRDIELMLHAWKHDQHIIVPGDAFIDLRNRILALTTREHGEAEPVAVKCQTCDAPAAFIAHFDKTDGSGKGEWPVCKLHSEAAMCAGWFPLTPVADVLASSAEADCLINDLNLILWNMEADVPEEAYAALDRLHSLLAAAGEGVPSTLPSQPDQRSEP